ncbi:hypothetical protein ACFVR2_17600 [Gottfriedia sp. NPDC057991]|uniref:hypothetical protein n=1 Tax=Gottfriedia sp. NPDC057991 TaxID=3346298 RepID=UPI0036D88006
MRLLDCLGLLSDAKLFEIGKNLQLSVFQGNRSWNTIKIVESLASESGSGIGWVIDRISKEAMNHLIMFILFNKPIPLLIIEELEKYGFLIKDIVPEEIRTNIISWQRYKFTKVFPVTKKRTKHSLFLKYVVILIYFLKKESINIKSSKNQKDLKKLMGKMKITFEQTRTFEELIAHAVNTGLISKKKNTYRINKTNLEQWFQKDSLNTIARFYDNKCKKNHGRLLQSIVMLQLSEEEWVNQKYFENDQFDLKTLANLGLTETITVEKEEYVKLSNEGWFLLKKEQPKSWNEKTFFVSADYELFIPYTCDPILLLEISPFCELKDCDYWLVFDITPIENNENKHDIHTFYEILKNHSVRIPDVIQYDYKKQFS